MEKPTLWTGPYDELQHDHPRLGEIFLGELVLPVEDIALSTISNTKILQPNAEGVLAKSATIVRGRVDESLILHSKLPIRLHVNVGHLGLTENESAQVIAYGPMSVRWSKNNLKTFPMKVLEIAYISETPDGLVLSSDEAAMKPWRIAQSAFYLRVGVSRPD